MYIIDYTNLFIGRNQICGIGGKAIGEAIVKNQSLIHLELSKCLYITSTKLFIGSNHIGDVGGKAIGEALLENRSLAIIFLSNFLLNTMNR